MATALQDILKLTRSQAECLSVLRSPGFSPGRIAVAARLDLRNTEAALRKLEELGLARQAQPGLWLVTAQGETCGFETVPDPRQQRGRPPRSGAQLTHDPRDRPINGAASSQPGASGQRLIDLLDRPMRGRELARELGLSRERVRQLLLDLHAQERIAFADPDHPSWLVRAPGRRDPDPLPRGGTRSFSAFAVTGDRRQGAERRGETV